MSDRWRFVDSISASPTVRLDLNDLTIWEVADHDLTPPELTRQASGSALVDGESISASWFGNRVVTLTLDLLRSSTDLAATQRQLLERELARPTNILEYRPDGATSSVFFKTFRSVGEMRREISTSAYWTFTVQILAEPFAYGLKETLSNVTLAANPASANGLEFTLTAANVKGDVETPLGLKFTDASKFGVSGGLAGVSTLVGVRRRGTVASMPYVLQCESMTAGTDTALGANNALYSGAGSNNMVTTFVTTALATRLTATVPATTTPEARGQYRVLAKIRATGAFTGQLQWNYGFTTVSIGAVPAEGLTTYSTVSATTNAVFVDLGILQLPVSQDPTGGSMGSGLDVSPGSLKLQCSRTSGTGNIVWDFVALVPADDNMCFVDWVDKFTASENAYIDGLSRVAYVGTDTTISGYPAITAPTAYPMITPNQDNRICVLPSCATSDEQYTLGTTHTVTPYYWPRYIDVRPAST